MFDVFVYLVIYIYIYIYIYILIYVFVGIAAPFFFKTPGTNHVLRVAKNCRRKRTSSAAAGGASYSQPRPSNKRVLPTTSFWAPSVALKVAARVFCGNTGNAWWRRQ
jgi:hypothetical protein